MNQNFSTLTPGVHHDSLNFLFLATEGRVDGGGGGVIHGINSGPDIPWPPDRFNLWFDWQNMFFLSIKTWHQWSNCWILMMISVRSKSFWGVTFLKVFQREWTEAWNSKNISSSELLALLARHWCRCGLAKHFCGARCRFGDQELTSCEAAIAPTT